MKALPAEVLAASIRRLSCPLSRHAVAPIAKVAVAAARVATMVEEVRAAEARAGATGAKVLTEATEMGKVSEAEIVERRVAAMKAAAMEAIARETGETGETGEVETVEGARAAPASPEPLSPRTWSHAFAELPSPPPPPPPPQVLTTAMLLGSLGSPQRHAAGAWTAAAGEEMEGGGGTRPMWPPSPGSAFLHLAAGDNPRRRTHSEGEGLLLSIASSAAIPLKVAGAPEPASWRGNRAAAPPPPPPSVDFRGGLPHRAPRELPPRAGLRTLQHTLPAPTVLLVRDETAVAEPSWRDLTAFTASTARKPGGPTLHQPPHQLLAAHALVGTQAHTAAAPRPVDAARRALTRRVLERGWPTPSQDAQRHRWGTSSTYRSLAITVNDGRPR